MVIKVQYDVNNIYVSTTESPVYIQIGYGSGGSGTVTSVDMTVPTGLTVSGNPITSSGTLAVGLASGYVIPTQATIDGKVPYSGATGNVDLGEYELKAGQIEFDQSPTGTAGVAVTRWNDTIGSTETTLKGGSVVLKNGVDLVARVVNKVTPNATLTKAQYQAVRVTGAQGQRLAVAYAQANNDNNSADTIGLVIETIPTNQEGFIITVGQIEGINTTGSLQGETWADGDVLYLSPTTPGALTNIKPVAPQHIVVIGYVEYAHQNNGKIYVKVMNGWELGELHDVNTAGATNGQVLAYNGSIWVPTTNGSGTVTSITASAPLTGGTITSSGSIGITQASGSADGYLSSTDWTTFNNKQNALTNPITGSAASGQVAYFTGATTQAGSNNLFWDNTNARLGIGTNTGLAYPLTIFNATNAFLNFNINSGSNRFGGFRFQVDSFDRFTIAYRGQEGNLVYSRFNSSGVYQGDNLTMFNATGNVVITGSGVASDGGQRLQVQGTTLLNGAASINGNTVITGTGSQVPLTLTAASTANNTLILNHAGQYNAIQINNNAGTPVEAGVIGWGNSTAGATVLQNSFYFLANRANVAAAQIKFTEYNGTTVNELMSIVASTGDVIIGSGSPATATRFTVSGSETASSAIARGTLINTTLVASANNDVLVGLDVNPTFTNGAFTGVANWAARFQDNVLITANRNQTTFIRVSNTSTAGNSVNASLVANGNGNFSINKGTTSTGVYKITSASDGLIYNDTAGDIAILNDFASGAIKMAAGASSTAHLRIFSNGNVGINQNTDGGQRLQVNGTTLFNGNSNVTNGSIFVGIIAGTRVQITNNQVTDGLFDIQADRCQLRVNNAPVYVYNQGDSSTSSLVLMGGHDGAAANFAPVIIGSGRNATLARETMRVNNQSQVVLIGTTTDQISKLVVGGSQTASSAIARGTLINTTLTAAANNDVLVGLDVNPTFTNGAFTGVSNLAARFTGRVNVVGNGTFGFINMSLQNTNASGWSEFNVLDSNGIVGGVFGWGNSSAIALANSLYFKSFRSGSYAPILFAQDNGTAVNYTMTISSSRNVLIGTTTDAGFRLDVNGTARVQGQITNTTGGFVFSSASPSSDAFYTSLSGNARFYVSNNGYLKATSSLISDTNGVGTINASAQLQVDSTTKGFLPPRMTETQKNAITTPAAGLMVYDTTNNKLYVYDGTTWQAAW